MFKGLGRYALTGLLGTIVHILVFAFLIHIGAWYVLASMLAFGTRSLIKFMLLQRWVFRSISARQSRLQFSALETLGLLLGTTLIVVFVEIGKAPPLAALLCAIVVLYIPMFLIHKSIFTPKTAY